MTDFIGCLAKLVRILHEVTLSSIPRSAWHMLTLDMSFFPSAPSLARILKILLCRGSRVLSRVFPGVLWLIALTLNLRNSLTSSSSPLRLFFAKELVSTKGQNTQTVGCILFPGHRKVICPHRMGRSGSLPPGSQGICEWTPGWELVKQRGLQPHVPLHYADSWLSHSWPLWWATRSLSSVDVSHRIFLCPHAKPLGQNLGNGHGSQEVIAKDMFLSSFGGKSSERH